MAEKVITLKRKMSGTGDAYDLENEFYDITIPMGLRYHYAVGGPAYYNLSWTRHTGEKTALKRYTALKRQGYLGIVILDADGNKAENIMRGHYDC